MACAAANGDGVLVPPPKGEADGPVGPVGPGPPGPKGAEVTDAEAVVVAPALCPVLEQLDACAACTSTMGSVKSRNALCAFNVPVRLSLKLRRHIMMKRSSMHSGTAQCVILKFHQYCATIISARLIANQENKTCLDSTFIQI